MPSPEQLAALARQTGYHEATLEKVVRRWTCSPISTVTRAIALKVLSS